jgi:hypothetical protein
MFAREAIHAITNRVRGLARQQNMDDVYVDEDGTVAIRRGPARVRLENSGGTVMIHRRGIMAEPISATQMLEEPDIEKAAQSIMEYLRHGTGN